LNEFHEKYAKQGLVVVGMYHPKPPRHESAENVKKFAANLKFEFPIAVDNDRWNTLKQWWLMQNRSFTSVSFLVDKKGIIRYIHPGGEFHKSDDAKHEKCQKEYEEVKEMIEKLVRE
jgi:peroxiredoxin